MDEKKEKDIQALIVSKKEELEELNRMAKEERLRKEAEQKAGQIQKINFMSPESTVYGKALAGRAENPLVGDEGDWAVVEIMFFGIGNAAVSALLSLIWMSPSVWLIMFLCIFVAGNAILLPLNKSHNKKQIKQTLADPIAQFEYRIAKAIATFNSRAGAYNHLLEGCKRGVIQKNPEDLEKIKRLLIDTRASLENKPGLLQWLKETDNDMPLSELPQMALSLQEMEEAERDLLDSVEQLALADPQMRLLENEVASDELEREMKLLSERTNQS